MIDFEAIAADSTAQEVWSQLFSFHVRERLLTERIECCLLPQPPFGDEQHGVSSFGARASRVAANFYSATPPRIC
jgi:hypothetical protein